MASSSNGGGCVRREDLGRTGAGLDFSAQFQGGNFCSGGGDGLGGFGGGGK